MNQALEGRRYRAKISQGYNHGHLWLSLQAHTLAPMKSIRLWVLGAWAKSTAPAHDTEQAAILVFEPES